MASGQWLVASEGIEPCSICFRWSWWALLPLALACTAVATPYLLTHSPLIGLALQQGFALVCHQRPERSLWIFGGIAAVCSRCLGIYLGATLGLLFRTTRTIGVRLLIAAAALNLLDAATELAGLHSNWLGVRFALGTIFGVSTALLVSSSKQGISVSCAVPKGAQIRNAHLPSAGALG